MDKAIINIILWVCNAVLVVSEPKIEDYDDLNEYEADLAAYRT